MNGGTCSADFDYSAKLTTGVLLGTIGCRLPKQNLQWDSAKMRFINNNEANKYISHTYRNTY